MMSVGKGEEWSCCAVKQLQFYHKLTGSVRWWHPGRRERKNSKTACFHSHSIYIRYSKNGVQTAECGGQTLNV